MRSSSPHEQKSSEDALIRGAAATNALPALIWDATDDQARQDRDDHSNDEPSKEYEHRSSTFPELILALLPVGHGSYDILVAGGDAEQWPIGSG
jgi:hypothetical protein